MKKLLSLLCCLVLLLCAGSAAYANPGFAGGDGSIQAPYQIATADQLRLMATLVNEDTYGNEYKFASYELTADIDLGNELWTPIGNGYLKSMYSFEGDFNGNNHTITGLRIEENENNELRRFGLFGLVNGSVRNVKIDDSSIVILADGTGSDETGAIAGCVYFDGKVQNCYVGENVKIEGNYITGGVVGQVYGSLIGATSCAAVTDTSVVGMAGGIAGAVNGEIANCLNQGNVGGEADAGGIVGMLSGGIENCINEGSVDSEENAGGIVGVINGSITNGEVETYTINKVENQGQVTALKAAGGIAGRISSSIADIVIVDSINFGKVISDVDAGGIVGTYSSSMDGKFTVSGCTNNAAVSVNDVEAFGNVGGIIGTITTKIGTTISVDNCGNNGSLNGGDGYAGGILGYYLGMFGNEGPATVLSICCSENNGDIAGGMYGLGGIAGNISTRDSYALELAVENCSNSGSITTDMAGSRIGGIVGVLEPHNCKAAFTACSNSGAIAPESVQIAEEEQWFEFKVALGGIVGHIGENGVKVRPEENCGITSDEAVVSFVGCSNSGSIASYDDGQEYLTGDIYGNASVPVTVE